MRRSFIPATLFFVLRAATSLAADPGQPSIARITPPAGPYTGGVPVVIHGSDLVGPCAGNSCSVRVFFGTREAGILSASDQELVVVSPPHDIATVDVTVRRADQTAVVSRAGFSFLRDFLSVTDRQQVLLPIVASTPVNGAFGSRWKTEISMANQTP